MPTLPVKGPKRSEGISKPVILHISSHEFLLSMNFIIAIAHKVHDSIMLIERCTVFFTKGSFIKVDLDTEI